MERSLIRRLAAALVGGCALVAVAATGGSAAASVVARPGPARAGGPAAVPAGGPAALPAGVTVPAGVTAGIAVFDRQAATFTEQHNAEARFRSASVVKLLLALDYLWDRGPGYDIPAADRDRFDVMLRSSDDAAASTFWQRGGQKQIVTRMVGRLGLRQTAPPPDTYPGFWGYTALSAADTVRIYRYLLDSAPVRVRSLVMDNLRASTRCGTDGYDQSFGIPSAFQRPWAVKQGWSGFGAAAPGPCNNTGAAATGAAGVDLVQEALHTTGTVGDGDRSIVAVLTLHPDGTTFGAAVSALNGIVRGLRVPGAVPAPPAGTVFGTWGSGVRVRAGATTDSATVGYVPAGADVVVRCQQRGQEVVVPPYRNDLWAYLPEYGGFITNIYIRSPGNRLPGVPDC
jgi:hypothetical protein